MVTQRDVMLAAQELVDGRLDEHSVKRALWSAILSIQSSLVSNADKLAVVLPYADTHLPDKRTLRRLMAGRGLVYDTMLDALYWAEMLEWRGELAGMEHIGRTRDEQIVWRDTMWDLWHDESGGHGMARKTISMAALILDPLHCQLVPVDRHVLARLGVKQPRSRRRYHEIEQMVACERGGKRLPLALKHWQAWENWRQRGRVRSGCESHAGLSCRVK